jgi:rhamnose transport system permease protein
MMTRHSPTLSAMPPAETKRDSLAVSIAKSRELTLFIVLLVLVGATAVVKPDFLNLQNLRDVLLNVSIIGLLTAGMTIVMLMRHIDLSVASIVGVSAYAVGSLFVMFPQMPVVVAMLAGVGVGLAIGAVNGALVTFGRVPSLVATLSTLYIVRGAD